VGASKDRMRAPDTRFLLPEQDSLSLLLYGLATMLGITALTMLFDQYRVWEETPTLRKLSYGAAGGFGGLAIIGAYSAARWCRPWVRSKTEAVLVAIAVILGVGAVIYSDWALAVLTHNIIGRPKSDKRYIVVLYWMYFAAKRLPMLSS